MNKQHRKRPSPEGAVTGSAITIGTGLPWVVMIWNDASPVYFLILVAVWAIVLVGLCVQQPQSVGKRVQR